MKPVIINSELLLSLCKWGIFEFDLCIFFFNLFLYLYKSLSVKYLLAVFVESYHYTQPADPLEIL